jgi:hypothetical protein
MIDVFGLIAISIYLVILAALSVSLISQLVKVKKLKVELVQSNLDFLSVVQQLTKISDQKEEKTIEQTDGFIRFVSESRDWAFQYIEDVQQAINAYREVADVVPLSKDMTVEQAEKLSKAYDDLINFLPEDNLL